MAGKHRMHLDPKSADLESRSGGVITTFYYLATQYIASFVYQPPNQTSPSYRLHKPTAVCNSFVFESLTRGGKGKC